MTPNRVAIAIIGRFQPKKQTKAKIQALVKLKSKISIL